MPASFRLWGLAALVAGATAGAAGGTCSQARTEAAAPRPSRPPCAERHLDAVAAAPLAVRLEPRMRTVPPEITCAVIGDAGGGAILRCVATRHGGR